MAKSLRAVIIRNSFVATALLLAASSDALQAVAPQTAVKDKNAGQAVILRIDPVKTDDSKVMAGQPDVTVDLAQLLDMLPPETKKQMVDYLVSVSERHVRRGFKQLRQLLDKNNIVTCEGEFGQVTFYPDLETKTALYKWEKTFMIDGAMQCAPLVRPENRSVLRASQVLPLKP